MIFCFRMHVSSFQPNKGQQQNSFGQGTTVSFFVEEATTQPPPPPPPPTTTTTTQPTTTTRRSTTAEPIRFFVTTTRKIVPNRPEQRFELVDGDSERDREEVLQPVRPRPHLPSRPQRPFKNRPETNTFVPVTQAPTFESTIRSTSQRFFVPESFIRQQQQAEAIRRRILAQQQEQIRQQLIQRQFQQQLSQQLLSQQLLSQQQLSQQPIVNNAVVCADFDSRCPAWIGHCPFNSFVTQRCPLSCGLCRFRIQ
ncbi:unnamed protein product, partial [Mesorhabditis belari]|uniref:ShKT domain-containing protein n=1 Tax=Mesorhabditis belari TaxID=2138241 RepID=A0AAF3FTT0_9BILA